MVCKLTLLAFLDKPNPDNGELGKFKEVYDLLITENVDSAEVWEIAEGFS